MTRILSGVVMASIAIGVLLFAPPLIFFGFLAIVAGVALWEYFGLLKSGGEPFLPLTGFALAMGIYATLCFNAPQYFYMIASMSLVIAFAAAILTGADDPSRSTSNTVFGIFYVSLTFGAMAMIVNMAEGAKFLLMIGVTNAACDTFAYYTGRTFGKNPLAPKISPKKTVEGFIGGLAGSVIGAALFQMFYVKTLPLNHALVMGLIIGLVGPLGDLAESAIKRKMDVKDSGGIIPGHGGVLDRMDSLMFSAVVIYAYLKLAAGA